MAEIVPNILFLLAHRQELGPSTSRLGRTECSWPHRTPAFAISRSSQRLSDVSVAFAWNTLCPWEASAHRREAGSCFPCAFPEEGDDEADQGDRGQSWPCPPVRARRSVFDEDLPGFGLRLCARSLSRLRVARSGVGAEAAPGRARQAGDARIPRWRARRPSRFSPRRTWDRTIRRKRRARAGEGRGDLRGRR